MSYLVDALRKAERERKLGTVPDLATEPGAPEQAGRALPWWFGATIAVVIGLNLAALGIVTWQWIDRSPGVEAGAAGKNRQAQARRAAQQAGAKPSAADSSDQTTSGHEQAPSGPAASPATPESAGEERTRTGPSSGELQSGAESAPDGDAPNAPAASADADTDAPTGTPDATASRVQKAAEPGASSNAAETGRSGTAPPLRALPEAEKKRLPTFTVNGHLYSSIPGRSFVLINGRRYHEGERLGAGGAVESIDASGVVINYQGQRFHMSAPH